MGYRAWPGRCGWRLGRAVSGKVKPLPVIGAFARAMGGTAEGGYVELKVDVSYQSRPEWLEGDYDSWIAAWD